jgi:hypothetical protein
MDPGRLLANPLFGSLSMKNGFGLAALCAFDEFRQPPPSALRGRHVMPSTHAVDATLFAPCSALAYHYSPSCFDRGMAGICSIDPARQNEDRVGDSQPMRSTKFQAKLFMSVVVMTAD